MQDTSSKLDISKTVVAYDDATHTRVYAKVVCIDFHTFSHQDKIVLVVDSPITNVNLLDELEQILQQTEEKLRLAEREITELNEKVTSLEEAVAERKITKICNEG